MSIRALCVAAAVAAAGVAVLVPAATASPKDDPAVVKANRDAVRKKFKDAKKYPFADLSYYLDTTKMKEGRWECHDTAEPSGVDDNHPMFEASLPSGNSAEPAPFIDAKIWRFPHWKDEGGGKKGLNQYIFKACGKTVLISNVKELAAGFYLDFTKAVKDFIPEKSKEPKKEEAGPGEWFGYAVGTPGGEDPQAGKRIRRDWFLWAQPATSPPNTWIAQFSTSEKVMDKDEWVAKITEFMKNVNELKDPKLK